MAPPPLPYLIAIWMVEFKDFLIDPIDIYLGFQAGVFMQYFAVAVFSWMLLQTIDMYFMFVKVWNSNKITLFAALTELNISQPSHRHLLFLLQF